MDSVSREQMIIDLVMTVAMLKKRVERLEAAMQESAEEQGRLRAAVTIAKWGLA